MNWQRIKALLTVLAMAASTIATGGTGAAPAGTELTPPRLGFIDGSASFWRPGAEDWAPARVNTPLAAGDALYTAERSTLEIQVGVRAFVRMRERTQLRLANLEPDFMQFSVTAGQASIDLRSLPPGHTVELGTPNAIFTIEHAGYYRVAVEDDLTRFTTRRGGRATVMLADRAAQTISASEEVIVRGASDPVVETYVAPPLDAWDRWNYARTDHEIEALSGRYVAPGVYGAGALDDWGTWRVVPTYGPVWVPDRVASGWTPYSTGSWVWDPYYGWTWVDDAPWGWAPFHYGRWVFIGGYWAWAPGPVIARPVYAPALVAFFGIGHDVSVRIGIGLPALGWVALGWGEPLLPWWGRPGFIGQPWWGGWGGPRVVNRTVIERTTIVNVNTIVYEHTRTPRAFSAVAERQFGSGPVRVTRFSPTDPREITHIRDAHPVRPGPVSLVPARGDTVRPPPAVASKPVVATRPPREPSLPWQPAPGAKPPAVAPAPRVIAPPKRPEADVALPRPSFGERGTERTRPPSPPSPPRAEEPRRAPPAAVEKAPPRAVPPAAAPRVTPSAPVEKAPQRATPPAATPPAESRPAPRAAPPAPVEKAPPRTTPPAETRPAPRAAPSAPVEKAPQRATPSAESRSAPPAPPAAARPAAPRATPPAESRAAPPARTLPGRAANEVAPRQPGSAPKPAPQDKRGGQR